MNLFVIKGIAKAPLAGVIAAAAPHVVLMLIGLAFVLAFPSIATWLLNLARFG